MSNFLLKTRHHLFYWCLIVGLIGLYLSARNKSGNDLESSSLDVGKVQTGLLETRHDNTSTVSRLQDVLTDAAANHATIDYGQEVLRIGKLGSNRIVGNLKHDLLKIIDLIRDFPVAARTLAWSSYISEALNNATLDEIEFIFFDIQNSARDAGASLNLLTGGNLWDDIASRCTVKLHENGSADRFRQICYERFQSNDSKYREASVEAMARIVKIQDVSHYNSILQGYPLEYQAAVQNRYLDLLSKYNREKAFDFFLNSGSTIPITPKQIDSVIEPAWFQENAQRLSTAIVNAPASQSKDQVIHKMVKLIIKDDPSAAAVWANQITSAALKEETLELIAQ